MNLDSNLLPDWSAWGRREWSTRLYETLFGLAGGVTPVTHVPATRFDLRRVVADPTADPTAVEAAFVKALRSTPARTRDLLSTRSPEFHSSQHGDAPPGYLADLVLTCLVAAGGDEGTLSEGQFRERLRITLGHPVGTTYDLVDLGDLWESFADWLAERAVAGRARPLHLPNPGRMNRIGYSIRLAFPSLRDRKTLANVFASLRGEAPSTHEAVRLVRAGLTAFDERSRIPEALDDFTQALVHAAPGLHDHRFWAAVRDAVALDHVAPEVPKLRLGLVVDEPTAADVSFHLACADLPTGLMPPPGVWLDRLPAVIGGYDRAVQYRSGDPVTSLLRGTVGHHWTPLGDAPLARSAREGAVLFARDDHDWPVSRLSLPEPEADVWLLARTDVASRVAASVPEAPTPRPSAYAGWNWMGPLLAAGLYGLSDRFPELGCLRPTVPPPPIRLAGGVRSGATYLGVPGALPYATAPGASQVDRLDEAGRPTSLVARADGRFDDLSTEAVNGDAAYVARDAAGLDVGHVRARFVSLHVGTDYEAPLAGAWTVEGARAETVAWEDEQDGAPLLQPAPSEVPMSVVLARDTSSIPIAPLRPQLGAFVEVLAAISCTRSGLGEAEFLGLLRRVLGVPEGPLLWETARAWVEAGYVDVLTPRAWPNRLYVARRPRLVVWGREPSLQVALTGLAPAEVVVRFRARASELGAEAVERRSPSPLVPDAPVVRLASFCVAADLAVLADLPPLVRLDLDRAFSSRLAAVAASADESLPERVVQVGEWDWTYGAFSRSAPAHPVSLSRWTHPREPVRYLVQSDYAPRAFRSRVWAFLYAASLHPDPFVATTSAGYVVATGPTRVHFPVPLARALAYVAGSPGPYWRVDGTLDYAVPTTTRSLGVLSDWLRGQRPISPKARALARRLVPSLSESMGVPVPEHIAEQLRPFSHDPDVARLLRGRLSATLVPHVARLASTLHHCTE